MLHCPYCHGHEVRDRPQGVVSGGPGAVRYAKIVRQWTHDLVFFTPPDNLTATERSVLVARAIGVVEGEIEQLVIDEDRLCGVQMNDGCVVPRDALFVPPVSSPTTSSSSTSGARPPVAPASGACGPPATSSIRPGHHRRRRPPPPAAAAAGAGAGSAAAIALNADLTDDDVRDAVDVFHQGFRP